jgi:branched-chain amino acid transport system permease protein
VELLTSLPLGAVNFYTLPQQVANGILVGAIYALIALGYTMVYGVLKLINFAHGEVFMLGSYAAMFASWMLGFGPNGNAAAGSVVTLLIMLIAAMTVSGTAGYFIEKFAYRPIRNHPRIASLITAIGLSLFLQYGGQVFLLNGSKQAISSKVNPYQENIKIPIVAGDRALTAKADALQSQVLAAKNDLIKQKELDKTTSDFALTARGNELKSALEKLEKEQRSASEAANVGTVTVLLSQGKLIMFVTTIILMFVLNYLVMKTKLGRGMRAASLDFNAASLMGININTVISFTFILGSALAGAGAMMYSTFQSAPIDPFSGMAPGIKAFVAAVLGGIGNIRGAVLGAFVMGVSEALVSWCGYDSYRDAVAFVILILVLLLKPGGLLGTNKVEKV